MAVIIVLLLALMGVGQVVTGVYLLAGTGWALVVLGLATVLGAVIVSRGISHG